MKYGENIEFLKMTEETTGVINTGLRNMPKFTPRIMWYMKTFDFLSSSRSIGMAGIGPIPLSEIITYCQYFATIEDDDLLFCRIIKAMDEVYLTNHYKKKPRPPNSDKNTNKFKRNSRKPRG